MSKGLLLAFLAVTVALTTVVFFTRRTVNQRNVSQHAESKEAIIEKAKAIIQEIKTVKNEEALALTIEKFNKNMEKISTCPEAQKLRLNFELSLGQKYRQFAEEADVLKTLPETPAALKSITSAAKYLGPLQEKALLAKPDSILLLERLQQVARHRDSEDLKIKVAVQEFDKEVDRFFTSPFFTSVSPLSGMPLPFKNYGNSCYFNSVLQCFFSNPTLNNYLVGLNKIQIRDPLIHSILALQNAVDSGVSVDTVLDEAYRNVVLSIFSSSTPVLNKDKDQQNTGLVAWAKKKFGVIFGSLFVKKIKKIRAFAQQDAGEFFTQLVDKFSGHGSFPTGSTSSEITCMTCRAVSLKSEPSYDYLIPLAASVENAVNAFEVEERLTGANQPYCETCAANKDKKKKLCISAHSSLLILRLKREQFNAALDVPAKNCASIKVDEFLTVKEKTYALTGMVLHCGLNARSGHYIALVRDKVNPSQWWLCNDDQIIDGSAAIAAYYAGDTYAVSAAVTADSSEDGNDLAMQEAIAASLESNKFDVSMLFYQGTGSGE